MRGPAQLSVCLLLLGAACDPRPAPNFVVQVLGDPEALRQTVTTSSGLEAIRLQGDPSRLTPERFESHRDWSALVGSMFDVVATRMDGASSRVTLAPYLCAGHPAFAEQLRSGWKAEETHQIFLTSDGLLEL